MVIKVTIMEPICEVLETLVSQLAEKETGAGRWDRAVQLEMAVQPSLSPLDRSASPGILTATY
jgi:hypothetical protein